ncbi:hypothetical protein M430DRAFT_31479 [Amorphotheca resinae ATCC 22711]|uniref:Secreted protein n=1 Tax=Amorphotheca resinae ATCC 22711 TaxID=857342 RepID=A0A2T3ARA5_AMORE|nr:hypothetical protein M430DRAFT_31479 [Amorphotheca resinae ATCC 22711]PSS08801.1 hypothetical protein M430DRAFT_31479 [Amorphotheca resinae ATCC 22711]
MNLGWLGWVLMCCYLLTPRHDSFSTCLSQGMSHPLAEVKHPYARLDLRNIQDIPSFLSSHAPSTTPRALRWISYLDSSAFSRGDLAGVGVVRALPASRSAVNEAATS